MTNSEDLTFDIPLLGKVSQSQVEKFLPLYIKIRKEAEVKALIPKEMDRKIMAFAELKGLVNAKRTNLEDIEIPLTDLEGAIDDLIDEGYSTAQVAKLLDIYHPIVSRRTRQRQEQEEIEEKQRKKREETEEKIIDVKVVNSRSSKVKAWLKRRLL